MPVRLLVPVTSGRTKRRFRIHETPVHSAGQVGIAWEAVEMMASGGAAESWEQAYEARRGRKVGYAEPDLQSGFPAPVVASAQGRMLGGATLPDQGVANDQNPDLESGPGFAWHLNDEYSGLACARRMAEQGSPTPVRVAILDVGFDLTHQAVPPHLNSHLARNFSGDGREINDVNDYGDGLNPGHGAGTLSILASGPLPADMLPPIAAGQNLGGAPQAEIVPLKVANSVVLLKTSAFVEALDYLTGLAGGPTPVDVLSMSMGGVASRAWADAVNRAYEAGITMVTAAGNTKLVPLKIVYPARFHRVIAACGVMANQRPYKDVPFNYIFGCWGPNDKMPTALAAYTPNIPWAERHSPKIIDLDGQGTSSATPQIAAAAALWLRKHKASLTNQPGWRKVEAVRHALFSTGDRSFPESFKYYGNGVLQAHLAMSVSANLGRPITPPDTVSFAAGRIIFGAAPEAEMAEIELAQLAQREPRVDSAADTGDERKLRAAILESEQASPTLKKLAGRGYKPAPRGTGMAAQGAPPPPPPQFRNLRAFAYDPLLSTRLETYEFNHATLEVPWEPLAPGPSGEYLEVVDVDPPSHCSYEPIHLDHPHLLASDGLAPSVGNPQFHQQMTYAVAMRTIRRFEIGLGRRVMWSPRMQAGSERDGDFVRQLRIHPHALYEENAYYHPDKKALLFGYFASRPKNAGEIYRGGITFSCLSHDIIAHETTHAILDGVYRKFGTPTNEDQLAFHEAFADLVALFQHFTVPEALTAQIAKDAQLTSRIPLLELAQEFGKAMGMHGALRSTLGEASVDDYANAKGAHARGAVLVSAVFAAFTAVYRRRTADLLRSPGSSSAPHPDLVNRLAGTAARIAGNFLDICIRALDYCPPVDLTFGDYLRALVTADHDLVIDDPYGYRVSLIEAFRQRGIYPPYLMALGEDTLLWRPPGPALDPADFQTRSILSRLASDLIELDPGPGSTAIPRKHSRQRVFERTRLARRQLHAALRKSFESMRPEKLDAVAEELGLQAKGRVPRFQVHTLSLAERTGPAGRVIRQFVVSLLQSHNVGGVPVHSGSTILVDRSSYEFRYAVRKSATNRERLERNASYASQALAAQATYFAPDGDCHFAAIHAGLEE